MSATEEPSLVVVCTYRVRAGEQAEFERWLDVHAPTLRRLGLITHFPAQALRRLAGSDPVYVEMFEWVSTDAAARASEVPEVISIWEPMAALCESRDDLPGLEFASFVRLGQHG